MDPLRPRSNCDDVVPQREHEPPERDHLLLGRALELQRPDGALENAETCREISATRDLVDPVEDVATDANTVKKK